MPKKYESIYVGLAELVMELADRPTFEEKGRFIDEVVRCVVKQRRGINEFADSLMDQADDFREENRRRQQESRDRRRKEKEGQTMEEVQEQKLEQNLEPAEPKPATKNKPKKDSMDDPEKSPFGPFGNVYLSVDEESKLREKYGPIWDHALEILSSYKKAIGKTYKSDFAAFYSWVDKRLKEEGTGATKSFRQMDKDEAAQRARESFPGIMEEFQL